MLSHALLVEHSINTFFLSVPPGTTMFAFWHDWPPEHFSKNESVSGPVGTIVSPLHDEIVEQMISSDVTPPGTAMEAFEQASSAPVHSIMHASPVKHVNAWLHVEPQVIFKA
jgi:hypothetical protein